MANDSEATRAAGIDWTELTPDEISLGEKPEIVRCVDCKSLDGFHAATCRDTSRYEVPDKPIPTRENLEDLMRDTTDAMSGDKLKCLAQCDDTMDCCAPDCPCAPKPVAPDSGKDAFEAWLRNYSMADIGDLGYQYTTTVGMMRDAFLFAALQARVALESKTAPEGEVKVTWRVNYAFIDNPHSLGGHSLVFDSREKAQAFAEEDIPAEISFLAKRIISLVRIETHETVVDIRKKES